jgi:hypothetical protein
MVRIEEDRYGPKLFCDQCGEEINDAQDGNFEYQVDGTGAPLAGIFFTHKRCCYAFEMQTRREGLDWYAEELPVLPFRLAANLNMVIDAKRTGPMTIACTLQGQIVDL